MMNAFIRHLCEFGRAGQIYQPGATHSCAYSAHQPPTHFNESIARSASGSIPCFCDIETGAILSRLRRAKTSPWFDNFKTGAAFQVISSSRRPVLTIRA